MSHEKGILSVEMGYLCCRVIGKHLTQREDIVIVLLGVRHVVVHYRFGVGQRVIV